LCALIPRRARRPRNQSVDCSRTRRGCLPEATVRRVGSERNKG
jgi:hypothetical protein